MTGRSQRNSSAQRPRKSVSIHSIHGSTCGSWNRSVGGSSGDSYDNTMAESIIRFYKTEVIRPHGPWKSIDSVEIATLTELVGAIARARPCIPGLLVQQPADHGTDRISLFERSELECYREQMRTADPAGPTHRAGFAEGKHAHIQPVRETRGGSGHAGRQVFRRSDPIHGTLV
jgi:hypothetical protein